MSVVDVSILIVHATDVEILRQTLRGIRRVAPGVSYEVIIVDNNIAAGLAEIVRREFPEIKYIPSAKNVGFGAGMNIGIPESKGRYVFVFNPDILLTHGSVEELVRFMDANPHIGMCGPRLVNPDGTLQYSCYRLPNAVMPVWRRTPLGRLPWAQRQVDDYFMKDVPHDETMEVDSLLGGAMFARRSALEAVGLFDERFFLYYEDNDLCRRFWEMNLPVVYHPRSQVIHYHRRQTADGHLFKQILTPITWIQISSFFKYLKKYWGKSNPRLNYGESADRAGAGNTKRAR